VNPLWRIQTSIQQDHQRFPSPLQQTAKTFKGADINNLERIEPFGLAPWQPRAKVRILEHEQAEELANRANLARSVFTDASCRQGKVGMGVAYLAPRAHRLISRAMGPASFLNAHHDELMAIREACRLVDKLWPVQDTDPRTAVTIFSDSQSALQALARPRQQSGQMILRDIWQRLQPLSERWAPRIVFRWVPGHADVLGNERAHELAQKVTGMERMSPSHQVKIGRHTGREGILPDPENSVRKQSRGTIHEAARSSPTRAPYTATL
jgi:ribonuclease HI